MESRIHAPLGFLLNQAACLHRDFIFGSRTCGAFGCSDACACARDMNFGFGIVGSAEPVRTDSDRISADGFDSARLVFWDQLLSHGTPVPPPIKHLSFTDHELLQRRAVVCTFRRSYAPCSSFLVSNSSSAIRARASHWRRRARQSACLSCSRAASRTAPST